MPWALRGTTARTAVPSMNVIVPVGTPLPDVATAAPRVTAVPEVEGLGDVARAVIVAAGGVTAVTTCVGNVPKLIGRVSLPLYLTVTEWLPTASVDVVNEAKFNSWKVLTPTGGSGTPSIVKVT